MNIKKMVSLVLAAGMTIGTAVNASAYSWYSNQDHVIDRDYTQVKKFQDNLARSVEETIGSSGNTDNVISTEARIDRIKNLTGYVHNVIVGTPIRKIYGSSEVLPVCQEECEIMITDYEFAVKDYAFGSSGEKTITVRSQAGDIFEIGKEYTFAADHIDSVYYDLYSVVSQSWAVKHEDASAEEIESLLETVSKTPARRSARPSVIKKANPSGAFANNVDVAVVATISELNQNRLDTDVFNAKIKVEEVVKGTPAEGALHDWLRLKGDIDVGDTYLILFKADEDGNLFLASREGSMVKKDSSLYEDYIEVL